MKLTRLALTGAAGMMGLGLIGVGAHAAFTTTTQSHQQVSAGYLSVVLRSTNAAHGNTSKTLTLNASGTHGSTFTDTNRVTIINKGVAATFIHGSLTDTYTGSNTADTRFAHEAYVCVTGNTNTSLLYNGPLTGFTEALTDTMAPNSSRYDVVDIYAGQAPGDSECGTTAVTSLDNDAQGGQATVTYRLTYQG